MITPGFFKRIIKRPLQHAAASFGRHTRTSQEPELVILTYHRILPANDARTLIEEPGMIVSPETLRLHLDIIRKYFDVIRLSEWIDLKQQGAALPPRACAITFDDGWADNYEFAYPILKQMNIPATIFLTSAMIGTGRMFWPERLSRIVREIALNHSSQWTEDCLEWIRCSKAGYGFNATPPTQEQLAELIDAAKKLPDGEIHARLDRIEQQLKLPRPVSRPSLLDWDQVAEMIESGLIDVGSHTCHHVRMSEQTPIEVMEDEILTSKYQIERQTGQVVAAFCYPNGDYSPQALELVKRHYKSAITTKPGWNTADSDNYLLFRFGIHQGNANDSTAFLARISGWM